MIILDIIIVLLLGLSLLEGWRKGLITSLIKLVSSILIFVLAYLLKGPISLILIEHLPFISFEGLFAGITSLNVVVYEGIALILSFIILSLIFKIIIKLSGIVNRLINATIILSLPNKLGGALINFIRYYIIIFLILFIINIIPATNKYVVDSQIAPKILNETPVFSPMMKDINKSIEEIYELVKKIDDNTNTDELNREVLKILLKYDIIREETIKDLHDQGKLNIKNYEELIKESRHE